MSPAVLDRPTITAPPSDADLEHRTCGEMVRVADMFVDLRYGREPSEAKVVEMAQAWTDMGYGALIVSMRPDGTVAILDGGHRHKAAKYVKVDRLFCRVFLDLTLEEEATLFTIYNAKRTKPSRLDIFRSRLTAREPIALDITRIVNERGLEIALAGPAPGRIQAVGALDNIYAVHGADMLGEVLSLALEAWGTEEKRAFIQDVLLGLAAFWARREHFDNRVDRRRLVDRLKLSGPTTLIAKSAAFRTIRVGTSPDMAVGQAIVVTYDYGLKETHRLGEWPQKVQGAVARAAAVARNRRGWQTRMSNLRMDA